MKVDINTQNRLKTARIKMSKTCPSHKANKTWPMVRLGELGTMVRGNGIRRCETVESGCPCLRYGEIYTSFNVILDKPRSFVPKELFDRSVKIKKGDLVFTLTGENTEEIAKALAYLGEGEIAAGGDLAVWTGHGCDSKYLAYLMYSPQLISQKAATGNGNIVVHTSIKKLQQLEIPLPPHPVQREIVARLERELAAVEKMKKDFEALAETAKAEFKAELKEAFEEGCSCEKTWDEVFYTTTGKLDSNCAISDGKYPFFTCSKEVLRINEWAFDCEALLLAGNNAAGKYDVKHYVGKFNAYQRTYVLTLKNADWEYKLFQAQLENLLQYLQDKSKGTSTRYLTMGILRTLRFYVPEPFVQREVVARLDGAKAKAEKLEAKAREGVAVCETMRKAILKEAFEGG